MRTSNLQKLFTALLVAALLTATFAPLASAAVVAAPASVEADQLAGTLTGGQFATIWLGLSPKTINENITLVADWDRANPTQNGLAFYVVDASGLASVVAGGSPRDFNIAAGTSRDTGPNNQQTAIFRATGSDYTVIVANDSATDANFTLTATNGVLSDDSDMTRDPNAPAATEAAAEGAPAEAATPAATPEPAAPAATTAVTDTAAAAVTPAAAAPVAATTEATAVAPAVAPGTPVVVRATSVTGALPEQNDQHYLGLEPSQRDGEIKLTLTYDPLDNSELARRLNFWVLDEAGFKSYVSGTPASEVAFAAGNRTFSGQTNERVAIFNAAGLGPYTVIVYNNSQVPATYALKSDGALLIDDAGQTDQAAATGTTAAAPATTEAAAASTAPAAAAAPAAAGATTTEPAREGQPGGTYTVKSGDTIALIARDIYGDYTLYEAICKFSGIADCNTIEIGDIVKLPTLDQIKANATAPAAAATAAPAAAPAAAATAAPTAAAAPAVASPAAETTVMTETATTTATVAATTTTTAKPAATPTKAAAGSTAGGSLVAVAEANGNFTYLVKALQAAGLNDDLEGAGPFTVFAPTDAAFEALGAATLDALLKDTTQLKQILLYHVVNSNVASSSLKQGMEVNTLQGSPVEFTLTGSTAKVQDSNIVVPDVKAGNGTIHIIDKVMLPPAP
jgi:uncharacterized surface protein with fasciclin (FAS1) repeats